MWDAVLVVTAVDQSDEIARLHAALAREKEKVRALEDVGLALGSTLDLEQLLERVLGRIAALLEADRATLYLLEEEKGELVSRLTLGGTPSPTSRVSYEIRLRVGEGLAGWVARSGEIANIGDAYADVRFDAAWDRKSGYRTRSILCVPMKNHVGRIIGVLQVLNKRLGPFNAEDEVMLLSLASQAAVSIENSKLFLSVVSKNMELLDAKEQLERKIAELDVLFEIAQVAASATDLDGLLEGVIVRAMRAVGAVAGSVLLGDEKTGDLIFRNSSDGKARRLRVWSGQGISGWVAKHQEPIIIENVEHDSRYNSEVGERLGYTPSTSLTVPLRWKEGSGALELFDKAGGTEAFTADDLKLAGVIAGHVSSAIGLARSRETREREERLSTIGRLLSSVLHDLKTPMTVVSGYTQLLMNEPDATARRQYAESVLKQVRLINAMTREILAFARGDRTVLLRKVYLATFFDEVREQIERELAERNVRVVLKLGDRGIARFDQYKVERAIHNLARNAAEAIGDKGGEFVIEVGRRPEDAALVIRAIDNGPGIPDAIRDGLFQSFTTHGKAGGTGLGLAIVRKVVEDHDGEISVDSVPGRTCFTIVLPQQRDIDDRPSNPHSSSLAPPATATSAGVTTSPITTPTGQEETPPSGS